MEVIAAAEDAVVNANARVDPEDAEEDWHAPSLRHP